MYWVWGRHPSEKHIRPLSKPRRDRSTAVDESRKFQDKGYLDVVIRASVRQRGLRDMRKR